jgi:hypothetical protein
MQFQTPVELDTSPNKISLHSPLLLLGSCFSDEIGKLLATNKLNVLANPFGVIFNPLVIFHLLELCLENKKLPEKTFVCREEMWLNFLLHSSLSSQVLGNLQVQFDEQQHKVIENFLTTKHQNSTRFLFLTFGTAWVYVHKEIGISVANCHKLPANLFEKKLLTVEEIVNNFAKIHKILPENTQVILTVSPVRHLKDTLPLNTVSKATLILSCYELAKKFTNVQYFPAYELLTDELRDYRFYEPDMIHPTKQAVEFIFERFCNIFIEKSTLQFIEKWKNIYNRLQHRPLNSQSPANQQFLKILLADMKALKEVELREEITEVINKIV